MANFQLSKFYKNSFQECANDFFELNSFIKAQYKKNVYNKYKNLNAHYVKKIFQLEKSICTYYTLHYITLYFMSFNTFASELKKKKKKLNVER